MMRFNGDQDLQILDENRRTATPTVPIVKQKPLYSNSFEDCGRGVTIMFFSVVDSKACRDGA